MHAADIKEHILALAASHVGRGRYSGKATLDQAPLNVNCFTFVQWLWRETGIIVPEHLLAWKDALPVEREHMQPCDLTFTPRLNRSLETDDFGHVGIVGRDGWIIHASRSRGMIGADSPTRFFERGCLGVRRIPLPQ
jgi:cell wall-associated NlpC family hydrolase